MTDDGFKLCPRCEAQEGDAIDLCMSCLTNRAIISEQAKRLREVIRALECGQHEMNFRGDVIVQHFGTLFLHHLKSDIEILV